MGVSEIYMLRQRQEKAIGTGNVEGRIESRKRRVEEMGPGE